MFWRQKMIGWIGLALLGLTCHSVWAQTRIDSLRLGSVDRYTRFVVELSAPVKTDVFALENPPRIVVDLPNVIWKIPRDSASPRGLGLVKTYRYGQFKPGISRIVLDLNGKGKISKQFFLPPATAGGNHRLVIDLEAAPVTLPVAPPPAPKPVPPAPILVENPSPVRPPAPLPIPSAPAANPNKPAQVAIQSPTIPKQVLPPPAIKPNNLPPVSSPPSATPKFNPAVNVPSKPLAAPPAPKVVAQPAPEEQVVVAVPRPPKTEEGPTIGQMPRRKDGKRVVVIDPGHGGVDPGAPGTTGIYEKEVTLAVGLKLRDALNRTGKYHVVMTRTKDVFLPLRDRVAVARKENAELFLSLHADSVAEQSVKGVGIYTLSETASDGEAELLAAKENKADIIGGVDLGTESEEVANILIDLAQRDTNNRSASFANVLLPEMGKSTYLRRNSHRFAGFAVLKAPDVPSVLVELGFLSNTEDEAKLSDPVRQKKIADAMAAGITRYFKEIADR